MFWQTVLEAAQLLTRDCSCSDWSALSTRIRRRGLQGHQQEPSLRRVNDRTPRKECRQRRKRVLGHVGICDRGPGFGAVDLHMPRPAGRQCGRFRGASLAVTSHNSRLIQPCPQLLHLVRCPPSHRPSSFSDWSIVGCAVSGLGQNLSFPRDRASNAGPKTAKSHIMSYSSSSTAIRVGNSTFPSPLL